MNKRDFLKFTSGVALTSLIPVPKVWASSSAFTGNFFIQVQAYGAWDVSSFCDPKASPSINNWAKTESVKTAGTLRYAPWAKNELLFANHFDKMMVINGVDAYTGSHASGRQYNYTGSVRADYPSLSAAYAAVNGDGFAMPIIENGGQFSSGNAVVSTRVGKDTDKINSILTPNAASSSKKYIDSGSASLIQSFLQRRIDGKKASTTESGSTALPSEAQMYNDYDVAHQEYPEFALLKGIIDGIDDSGHLYKKETMNDKETYTSALKTAGGKLTGLQEQIKFCLASFKAGLTVAGDVVTGGFDSHDNHDNLHEPSLELVAIGVDYMWAVAEQLNIADRLVAFIGSDFARTPGYNAGAGKDHHSVGSSIFMKKDAAWANRTVGATDGGQKAHYIKPDLSIGNAGNGIMLEPKHVMQCGRKILGIEKSSVLAKFDLEIDEQINFLDSSNSTPQT